LTATGVAALDAVGIDKTFGDARVLRAVDVRVEPGRVHALLGENGAGKSTLIKIIAGVLAPDAGSLTVGDADGPFTDPRDAERNRVATLHQEHAVVPGLSVAENVMLGRPTPQLAGFVRWAALRREVEAVFARIGYSIDVERDAATLGPIERTMTLLARALSLDCRLLILDEPTAALTDHERSKLFAAIRRAASLGVGVLYVSHRLDEVFEIADTYTVLRNGAVVAHGAIADTTTTRVITAMTGRSIDAVFPPRQPAGDAPALRVRGLTGRRIRDVDLDVPTGEILGVAGLAGSGRSELLRIIGGAQRRAAGSIAVHGTDVRGGHPWHRHGRGVAYVPEDRRGAGLLPDTATRNLNATTIGRHRSVGPFASTTSEREHARSLWRRFQVRGASMEQPVLQLSGGNQQKIVLAKFLALDPRVVLLDEPTAGVDVGTKAEIYRTIADLAGGGAAVVVVGSELLELVGLCHRIVVLHQGRIVGEFPHDEFDERRILAACFGEDHGDAD
jgi:ABC-type sugar transport system ATPase subunit